MKWLFRTLGSAVAALVVTAGVSVITVIWLMFSAGAAEGRRLGYFDALFVEVTQQPGGPTGLGVGLNDPVPLLVTVVIVTVLLLAVLAMYDQLLLRKKQLLADAE